MTNSDRVLAAVAALEVATLTAIAEYSGLHLASVTLAYVPSLVRSGRLLDLGGGLYAVNAHG